MITLRDLIGIPYKVHGRNREGMDCYGLAIEIYKRLGKTLPDAFSGDLSTIEGIKGKQIETPEPYCLILFEYLGQKSHIGIYLGNQKFIHASGLGVVIQNLSKLKKCTFYKVGE